MHHFLSHSFPAIPNRDTESIGSNHIFDLENHHSLSVSPVTEIVASRTRSHCSSMQLDSWSLLSAVQRTVEARWLANYSNFSKQTNRSAPDHDDDIVSSIDSQDVVDNKIEPYLSDNELDL